MNDNREKCNELRDKIRCLIVSKSTFNARKKEILKYLSEIKALPVIVPHFKYKTRSLIFFTYSGSLFGIKLLNNMYSCYCSFNLMESMEKNKIGYHNFIYNIFYDYGYCTDYDLTSSKYYSKFRKSGYYHKKFSKHYSSGQHLRILFEK